MSEQKQNESRLNIVLNIGALVLALSVAVPVVLAVTFLALGWMFSALHFMLACLRGGA